MAGRKEYAEGATMGDLEKHMGVNQFSIYERQSAPRCLKSWRGLGDTRLNALSGKVGFKKYLLINTIHELGKGDGIVKKGIIGFIVGVKAFFEGVLTRAKYNGYIEPGLDVERYANYLVGVLQGLSTAGKHFLKRSWKIS